MKTTATLFEVPDIVISRPRRQVANLSVEPSEDSVTGVAGIALWGPLLDRLNVLGAADEVDLRPIGPGGYSGGECYRAVVELQLAGGDFLSDRSLLADAATQRLRGQHPLPSHTTLWRFCNEAGLGRVQKAAVVNRTMLRRAWAMGAAPRPGVLTIDPDATWIPTYGIFKEGSTFSYKHEVSVSPMVGVVGETGDVLAVRGRAANANPGRAMGSFIDECVRAIPAGCRDDYHLWIRVDSAGYQEAVVEAARRHGACFTVTAKKTTRVNAAIDELFGDPKTTWVRALGAEEEKGSEVAARRFTSALDRDLTMIVRRQPTGTGDQLSFDDRDGWRTHAIVTDLQGPPEVIEHHRLRGGAPEEAIRQLKGDFGLNHAPLENFFGNWLWWQAAALAYNVARWLRPLGLPKAFRTCRGKRLRLSFFNVAARVVSSGRTLALRLPRAYAHADAFIEALTRIRNLPTFA